MTWAFITGGLVGLGAYLLVRMFVKPQANVLSTIARIDAGLGGYTSGATTSAAGERVLGGVDRARETLGRRLEDHGRLSVADATAGARAFAWSALVAQNARTVAVVAPSEDRARRWRAELAGWLGEDRVLVPPGVIRLHRAQLSPDEARDWCPVLYGAQGGR